MYCKTLFFSTRNEEVINGLDAGGGNYIFTVWHGRLLTLVYYHRNRNITTMISKNRDGELATPICEKLGFNVVRGSSSAGGKEALFEFKKKLADKVNYSMTVDGPRGPYHKVKHGAISFSSSSQIPVIPLNCIPEKPYFLKGWDKFLLPRPFSKIIVTYGDPIQVPPNLSKEELNDYCEILGNAIDRIEN